MDFRVGLVFGAFLLLADRPFSRGPAGWGQECSEDWTDAEVTCRHTEYVTVRVERV